MDASGFLGFFLRKIRATKDLMNDIQDSRLDVFQDLTGNKIMTVVCQVDPVDE